jgi:release factor glutamine methyltransferase
LLSKCLPSPSLEFPMSNTCLEILKQAVEKLRSGGVDRPRTNAELLLEAVLNAKKIDLYLDRDRILTSQQIDKFNQFLLERISGRPLQYILGSTEFFGLEFEVNENVLIPRPETETLVETVIESLKGVPEPRIIDLGTGSGAIAISLARNLKNSFVFATDISAEALKVAEKNARTHVVESQIELDRGDLFEPLKHRYLEGTVDCVVSNPPYVSEEEFNNLPKEVREFEPITALKTGEEGTSFHREIIDSSFDFLNDSGILALEVGLGQASKVVGLIRSQKGFKRAEIKKDLGGIERIVLGRRT